MKTYEFEIIHKKPNPPSIILNPELEKIIKTNKVLIEYARENNLNIEEIKKFLEDSTKFYKRILTDKEFRHEVLKEIIHHIRSL